MQLTDATTITFLSPLSNQRADAYGGSLANRMRFPLEAFDAVRAAWLAERPLGVRISATDWVDGGWTVEESGEFGRELKARGCDFITVSSGGGSPKQQVPVGEGYQLPLAAAVREAAGLPVMGVGMLFDPAHANRAIEEGQRDLAAIARGLLHDPHWAWRAAAALGGEMSHPPQYIRGYLSSWLREQRAGSSGA